MTGYKNQEKWWVYANRNIKTVKGIDVPMDFLYPHQAIARGSSFNEEQNNLKPAERIRVLVSPSVLPEEIQDNFCIITPPHWMQILNCKSSGDVEDAQHIKDVREVLEAMHSVSSNKPPSEQTFNRHALSIATDILNIPLALNSKHSLEFVNWAMGVFES